MTYNDSKSESEEDLIIYNFFKRSERPGFVGKILDIGANDGITFSNSYALINLGWRADLIEPAPKAFTKLKNLYNNNSNVELHNFAIGNTNGEIDFYDTDKLDIDVLHKKDNISLTSSIYKDWSYTNEKIKIKCMTFNNFLGINKNKEWDCITIDTEGLDYDIFRQINMVKLNCKCLCIEYYDNNIEQILELANARRLHKYYDSGRNLIFIR